MLILFRNNINDVKPEILFLKFGSAPQPGGWKTTRTPQKKWEFFCRGPILRLKYSKKKR